MKQLAKVIGKRSKNQINEMDSDPYTANKNSDSSSIQDHPQDEDVGSNKVEHESSRISKGKYNLNTISGQLTYKQSCFTKVIENKAISNSKIIDKENIESNNDFNASPKGSENPEHSEEENISHRKTSLDWKVNKFLDKFKRKFNLYVADNQCSIADADDSCKRIEEYIRSLPENELEQFLKSNDQQESEDEDYQPSYSVEPDKKIELDEKYHSEDEIKSDSSTSEISQEEIIMMTNLPTEMSCLDRKKQERNYADEKLFKTLSEENLVPISLSVVVEGKTIFDSFLWNADNNDDHIMRQFGLQILSEKLGRSGFTNLSQDSKKNFSEAVMETIKLNVNTYNKLKHDNQIGTLIDKLGTSSQTKEHNADAKVTTDCAKNEQSQNQEKTNQEDFNPIAKISITINDENGEFIEDTFYWDVTCCLNRPEEFARKYCHDIGLSKMYEKQVSFAIRKQIFDHHKQISFNKKLNILKKYQVPINKQTHKILSCKDECRLEDPEVYGKSDYSEREYYIPNDFYPLISSFPNNGRNHMTHRNHNFSYRGMGGKCDKERSQKFKKLDAPKNIILIVKKIYPNNDEEEDYEDESIQYCCEQLIVGNRKTKIIQKPEKVRKENSRRILKKSYETTNNKQSIVEAKESEQISQPDSMPQVITGIVGDSDESSENNEEDSESINASESNKSSSSNL